MFPFRFTKGCPGGPGNALDVARVSPERLGTRGRHGHSQGVSDLHRCSGPVSYTVAVTSASPVRVTTGKELAPVGVVQPGYEVASWRPARLSSERPNIGRQGDSPTIETGTCWCSSQRARVSLSRRIVAGWPRTTCRSTPSSA